MPDSFGPHLLGRLPNRPDLRDWRLPKLLDHLEMSTPTDGELLVPLGLAIQTQPWFVSWSEYRLFWRFVKKYRNAKPVPAPVPVVTDRAWSEDLILDQGDYGTCIGNGGAEWLRCDPSEDPNVDEALARRLYYEATVFDGTPDDPDAVGGGQQGSTVRSLAKALQKRGRLAAYAFATSMDEVDQWLLTNGSVIIGIDWTEDMFNPDGFGTIKPTGAVAGGHCVLINEKVGRMRGGVNSWGEGWGRNGRFQIDRDDLDLLLHGIQTPGDFLLAAELPL